MPALEPTSLILVTGITGYVGSHIGLAALQAGHSVRGTIRSIERAKTLKIAYETKGISTDVLNQRLIFTLVNNLSSERQWLKALDGVDGAAHPALPMDSHGDPQYVEKTINNTLAFMRAARKTPSIKRVVLTSALATVVSAPMYRDKVLNEDDWNDDAIRIVENNEPVDKDPLVKKASPFLVYSAAKAKAEKAAWEFVRNEKPQFDLVIILPNVNFGPVLHGDPRTSAAWIAAILKNNDIWAKTVAPQRFIDVRDDARLHLLALTTPSAAGRRILGVAEPYGWNKVLAILRKQFPNLKLPEDIEDGEVDQQKMDNSLATELLGGWNGLEQSLFDLAKSLGY